MAFTHLQIHSGYSFFNSIIKIPQLTEAAAEMGYTALALTDDSTLYASVSFYQHCLRNELKPIIGMTIPIQADQYQTSLILLAENNKGYEQLLRLSSHLNMQAEEHQALVVRDLEIYASGVIAIWPGDLEAVRNAVSLHEIAQVFKDKLFIGVTPAFVKGAGEETVQVFQQEAQLPLTALGDVRYLKQADADAYACLQAMKEGAEWEAEQMEVRGSFLRSPEQMREASSASFWQMAIEQAGKIAENCSVTLDFDAQQLPAYPLPEAESADDYLTKLCYQALEKKYPGSRHEAEQRLKHELTIIKRMKFSDYFLIVWDFIAFAKQQQIGVGPGRGSAAGSIVAYLLGITAIDPLQYKLVFERFLNPERISMPDIDVDFSDYRRDEVIQYVKDKYGKDHVAQIITFGTFAARSLLRELIKTMKIPQEDAAYLLRSIPNGSKSLAAVLKASEELTAYVKQSPLLMKLFRIAVKLEGLPRHASTHAAGVVISEQPLMETVPLAEGHHDVPLTQFPMKELEALGLLKMDFLGLRNLTLMERIIQGAGKRQHELAIDKIPLDDEQTYQLFRDGKTNGVFQFESSGMRQVLKQLQPTAFEDIVAVNALYRPGPMNNIPIYIARKHGREKITYPHPDLKPILEETYGVLVYQEQIMQIASRLAGYSMGEADLLRRAVSKKEADMLSSEQDRFLKGCIQNGYSSETAQQVFDWIISFANYGFNKSHAVAYSYLAYQLGYLKAHYPADFFAELMSSSANQPEKIRMYQREAAEFGIRILPPSINKSYGKYTVEKGHIRIGLTAIKGIGAQVVKEIIAARKDQPFKSLFDFCLRVPKSAAARQLLEQLILAGAFDETYSNRASLLASIDQALEQAELFREISGQASLFPAEMELEANYQEQEPFTEMTKLKHEKDTLGFYLSSHPLSGYRQQLRSGGLVTVKELQEADNKKQFSFVSILLQQRTIRTKKGQPMSFLIIGDETAEIEAVVFPDLHRKIGRWLEEEACLLLKGKCEKRNGTLQVILQDGELFEEVKIPPPSEKQVFIRINAHEEQRMLDKLKEFAAKYPGNSPIIVYLQDQKKTYRLAPAYSLDTSGSSLRELKAFFGQDNVALN